MSNFICSECGMTNIDCGRDGYKTPKEIELEKENEKLKKCITELKVRLLDTREARDNATKVANTYLDQNADLSKKVHILNEANMKLEDELGHFAEASKTIKRLQEQLNEANEVIERLRTYDFTVDDENAEYYQVKWNVEAKRFYKNRKWGVK